MSISAGPVAKLKKWVRSQQEKKARNGSGRSNFFKRNGQTLDYEVGKLLKSRGQQIILMSATL